MIPLIIALRRQAPQWRNAFLISFLVLIIARWGQALNVAEGPSFLNARAGILSVASAERSEIPTSRLDFLTATAIIDGFPGRNGDLLKQENKIMNPMDILGELLKQKSGSSGLGGEILKSIVNGGRSSQPGAQESRPVPQMPSGGPRIVEAPSDQADPGFESLDDLLHHAHKRGPTASSQPTYRQTAPQPPVSRQPMPQPQRQQSPPAGSLFPKNQPTTYQESTLDQRGELLVQAMINAAKADGQIDQTEQDKIVQHMGQLTQEDIEYLRREFAKPLNLRDFAWSVPLGAEHEIYAMSLLVMNLDSQAEANYLKELAHGLRLTPAICAQIHQHYGAPVLQ